MNSFSIQLRESKRSFATDQQVAEALREYQRGKLFTREIAEKYGVSQSTITVWAKKAGLNLRPRGRNRMTEPTPRQRIMLEMTAIYSYEKVGQGFGMSKQAVGQLRKRWHVWMETQRSYRASDQGTDRVCETSTQ